MEYPLTRLKGKITYWNSVSEYGWIKSNNQDYYFCLKSLAVPFLPMPGDPVIFSVKNDRDSKPAATNIKKVDYVKTGKLNMLSYGK
jgi:hypothetical protein